MKLEELMLNDWVLYNGNPCKVARISERLFLEKDEKVFYAPIEKITPLPLTKEILEKNGWKYNPTIKAYEWQHEAFYISINLDEKTRIYVVNDYIFGMALGAVHELQHALRLCGIEKTINL